MVKVIALKRFHYPSGPTGKDYNIGDEVELLSDRDAKALRLIRHVKDIPPKSAAKPSASPAPPRTTEPSQPFTRPTEVMSTESADALVQRPRRYRRTDMTPEE